LDITIYGFIPDGTPAYGGSSPADFSPFVLKLETYLKMVNADYKKVASSPQKSPNGKLPYSQIKGKTVTDSMFSIEALASHGLNLDSDLDDAHLAKSRLIQLICENSFYWVLLHDRFINEINWEITKSHMQKTLPIIFRPIVPPYVRRKFKKQLVNVGYGRFTDDEIYAIGDNDLRALSTFLGDQRYFLGDRPHSIDSTIFGFLWIALDSPHAGRLVEMVKKYANLVSYKDRVKNTFWPDWDKVIQSNWDKNMK